MLPGSATLPKPLPWLEHTLSGTLQWDPVLVPALSRAGHDTHLMCVKVRLHRYLFQTLLGQVCTEGQSLQPHPHQCHGTWGQEQRGPAAPHL